MTSDDNNSSVKKEKSLKEVELKPLFSSDGNESISSFEGIESDDHHPSHGGGHGHEFGVGTASPRQVVINIFISFVGSGMLGMPYAFSRSGWVLGILCLGVISALNVYAMLLLVKTRRNLESKGHTDIEGYGDVGRVISGTNGERFVNICLVISQLGFATAYIIFIAANINNIAGIPRAYICFGCVPILAVLVQLQDMKHLSPFSLIADVANLAGLTAVLCQDWEAYHDYHEPVMKFNWSNMLYVSAVALYSLEGVGMVLPLESSCENRDWFPSLLKKTLFAITSLMAVFGCCGYFAFGSVTAAPITLNLDGDVSTIVKLALCLGLYLTYPIMMFPVNEVIEDIVLGEGSRQNKGFRAGVVLFSAFIAWSIPDFGKFLSLVGASICVILGFILPSYFHLQAFERSELKLWEIMLDYFLLGFGVLFGILGTYQSFVNLMTGEGGGH
ncbi:amino acid/polyamine transporter [Chaetoceros tenuissimus]|uniref:Amino acid/polyamine transporter n=1 Tax=Chaetoceros tenuissimus TaxID=426638 RepID=A0AAD3HCS4_9STRA|nr:amino acid/polyamine transporter [Chaetoceros tenuissimus]